MGSCCGYINQSTKDKTIIYSAGKSQSSADALASAATREKQIMEALKQLQDDANNPKNQQADDQVETSSQPSFLYIPNSTAIAINGQSSSHLQSIIQQHGTIEFDEVNRFRKEPFYGAEALSYMVDMNLSNIAKEEVTALQAEQLGLEVKEHKKLTISHSMDIIELERKKSEIVVVKEETLQVLNPEEKDEMIRRTSSQFEYQQTILKQQQQQLLHQQELLEKQQKLIVQQQVQQQQTQQIAAAIKSQAFMKLPSSNTNLIDTYKTDGSKIPNAANGTMSTAAANPILIVTQEPKSGQSVQQQQQQQQALGQQGKSNPSENTSIGTAMNANTSNSTNTNNNNNNNNTIKATGATPLARGRMATENDTNTSADSAYTDRPKSIMKRRGNSNNPSNGKVSGGDLNSSYDSDLNSQKGSVKKKVKFKDSTFKKPVKKKKY